MGNVKDTQNQWLVSNTEEKEKGSSGKGKRGSLSFNHGVLGSIPAGSPVKSITYFASPSKKLPMNHLWEGYGKLMALLDVWSGVQGERYIGHR